MKSETADMKNSVNDSYGGTIRGAIFLKQFIKKGTRWAHLDIAATAWANVPHLSYYPETWRRAGLTCERLAKFCWLICSCRILRNRMGRFYAHRRRLQARRPNRRHRAEAGSITSAARAKLNSSSFATGTGTHAGVFF